MLTEFSDEMAAPSGVPRKLQQKGYPPAASVAVRPADAGGGRKEPRTGPISRRRLIPPLPIIRRGWSRDMIRASSSLVPATLLRCARAAALAALAVLAITFANELHAVETTVTQSGAGATWSLVGQNTVAAGQTYTYTLTRTSGSLPANEYFGFTSNTLEAARFKNGTSGCTGTHYFCFTISNTRSTYSVYTVSGVRFAGRILTDTSPHVLTLNVATGTPTGTTVTLGVVNGSGLPRSGGLLITVGTATTNTAPTVANAISDQTATAGTALNYAFPTNTFADTDTGNTLTYTATKSDDSALPAWLSFTAATRTFSGTPQAADVGTVSVKVTASDGTDSVSDTFDIVVSAAPSNVLVSNVGQTDGGFERLALRDFAQSFTTGANPTGYTLTSIELRLLTGPTGNAPTVKLFSVSATGTEESTFAGPAMLDASTTKNYTFTPPSAVTLLASTTYWVVAEGGNTGWLLTGSTREDATSATGWSIAHGYESRPASATGGFTATSGTIFQIRVNGTTVAVPNTPPTAADNTVTAGVGAAYTFEADHFGFADTDTGDTLASVKIVTLPAVGTLALDGTAVLADAVVTKAQIDGGMLTFTPVAGASGIGYASFTFKVNDGTDDSTSAYTMTIDVAVLPAITIAADRDKATGKLDWIHYTLSREGDTAAELTVTVTFAGPADNDWSLSATKNSREVTFAADSATAEQSCATTGAMRKPARDWKSAAVWPMTRPASRYRLTGACS